MPVQVNVNTAPSFFQTQANNPASNDLISSQIDPTQPQIPGLTSYTDPLVVDQTLLSRLSNFDPELYNLHPSSHLIRFVSALLGAAGVGGMRRQQTINRLASTMAGANFTDLDSFWGSLFGAFRMSDEALPKVNGTILNPATVAADPDTWEAARSRDGKFRSRIVQLAQAFAHGATYDGVRMAAEAVLACEVDVMESWALADTLPSTHASTLQANNYYVVNSQYHTYGGMRGVKWGTLQGGVPVPGNTPLGNRGEVVITPKRAINNEERIQVAHVLSKLAPVGVVVTVLGTPNVGNREVFPRFVYADSTDWSVSSSVSAYQDVSDVEATYPSVSDAVASSRPAMSNYSGERWSYNSRVSTVSAYTMVDGVPTSTQADEQYLIFADGTFQKYGAEAAMLDPKQASLARAAAEGILINYPYSAERFG
jgi:hypothetical protein